MQILLQPSNKEDGIQLITLFHCNALVYLSLPWWYLNKVLPVVKEDVSGDDIDDYDDHDDHDDHDGYDDHDDCEVLLPWRSLDEDLPVVKEDVSGDDHKAELVDGQAGEGGHWKGQAGHL